MSLVPEWVRRWWRGSRASTRSGCLLPASDLAWAALCAESTFFQLRVRVLLTQTEGVCGVGLVPASVSCPAPTPAWTWADIAGHFTGGWGGAGLSSLPFPQGLRGRMRAPRAKLVRAQGYLSQVRGGQFGAR